jgi:small subunit ribosomal protein S16
MAVRIRLKRMGRRHRAAYRVAAMDGRRSRDSKVIELLGTYDPVDPQPERQVKVDRARIEYWLSVGAQPTDTVRSLLKKQGIGVAAS